MTRSKAAAAAPSAGVALTEARQGVAEVEQRLREVEREARAARQAVIDAQETQRLTVYQAAKSGERADVTEHRKAVAAREQDAADMEVVVAAHTDAVRDARGALRDVILEHAPELLDVQERHAAEVEQARGEMEQRHAAERAEQDAREQGVRAEAQLVLEQLPNLFMHALRGDESTPQIRPDRACPDLAPLLGEPSMPAYMLRAIAESRHLYRAEAHPKMI
jgi:hypothetical protein